MARILGTIALLLAGSGQAATPALPPPGATPSAVRPPRVVGWPEGVKPVAPAGFGVSAFARDLDSPRWLAVLPNGDVLVAESRTVLSPAARARLSPEEVRGLVEAVGGETSADRITLLRDADRDGTAEQRFVLIEGIDRPFGMLLRRDRLYVAGTDAVWSYSFLVGQTRVNASPRKVLELPAGGYNNHWTRSLAADPDEKHLYVGVGSATNVDEEQVDVQQPRRAAILRARWDGSGVGVFASGLRNPVGMAFEPQSGRLWAVVNERDLLGDDLVPDFLTEVREGAFYGWPYAYLGGNEDPRKAGERPDLVARTTVPDFALGAHVAPLGLAFYGSRTFPDRYHGGAFIGQHGSWNRSRFAGYSVVFVPFAGGRPAGEAEEFLTGFVKDEDSREVYGRPAGVAVARDGALLVADDGGNVIWRIAPQ
jgi:glucose/arabinose dehydrogenase